MASCAVTKRLSIYMLDFVRFPWIILMHSFFGISGLSGPEALPCFSLDV